jgi:hypothetical protein
LKPVQANSSKDPILKITQKRAGGVAQDVGPEFKTPELPKKEKQTNKKTLRNSKLDPGMVVYAYNPST